MRRLRSPLSVLQRNPDFTRLYAALLIAFAADWFATVALIGLVLETTDSAAAASVILVLQMAPFLVATPIAGMLADRLDRRKLLVAANVARGIVCVGLILAVDGDSVWIAFVVVAMLAFGAAWIICARWLGWHWRLRSRLSAGRCAGGRGFLSMA